MLSMQKLEKRVSKLEEQLRELLEQRDNPRNFTSARIKEVTEGIKTGKVIPLTAGWPPAFLPGGPYEGVPNIMEEE